MDQPTINEVDAAEPVQKKLKLTHPNTNAVGATTGASNLLIKSSTIHLNAFPSSLAEVKLRLAAAKAAEAARDAEAKSNEREKSEAIKAAGALKSTTPSKASSSTLLATRMRRSELENARQSLEEKLCMITWVEFQRQAQAIEFIQQQRAQTNDHDGNAELEASSETSLRLFAYELGRRSRHGKSSNGARRFIVTSYQDFWIRYFTFPSSRRHHYELILEDTPCHLYFDIEFKFACNPLFKHSASDEGVDPEEVMSALCEEIVDQLNDRFAFNPPVTTEQILQLDSTSSVKFSRHLIVQLNQCHSSTSSPGKSVPSQLPPANFMFRSNAHAGRFVRYLCQTITRKVRQEEAAAAASSNRVETECEDIQAELLRRRRRRRLQLLQFVLVHESDPNKISERTESDPNSTTTTSSSTPPMNTVPMIDQSVYSRNRSFRLFLSSKNAPPISSTVGYDGCEFEQPPILVVAEQNQMPLTGVGLKEIFMASLICNMQCSRADLQLLSFNDLDEGSKVSALDSLSQSSSSTESPHASSTNPNGKRIRATHSTGGASSNSTNLSRRFHTGPSPFKRLEQFLLEYLTKNQVVTDHPPRISGWTYFKERADSVHSSSTNPGPTLRHTVTFNVSHYRYCEHIGRAHVSNGVYFVLDLVSRTMQQRCWDPDCRYFQSRPVPIPNWIADLEMVADEEDEEEERERLQAEEEALLALETRVTSNSHKPQTTSSTTLVAAPTTSLVDDEIDWDAIQS